VDDLSPLRQNDIAKAGFVFGELATNIHASVDVDEGYVFAVIQPWRTISF
jgi:hypothetical protein